MRLTHAQFAKLQGKGNRVEAFTLTLPYPPSVNHYWTQWAQKTGKGHHRVRMAVSKRGTDYREAVSLAWIEAGRPRAEGRLTVEIEAYPPDRRVRDVDNLTKASLDALTHAGAWADDGQIDDLRIVRRGVCPGGKVVVRVRTQQGEA
jgi:crossover junction endodeoxyribonuclease RusA